MSDKRARIPALRIHQWLEAWDAVDYTPPHRRQPEPYVYLFGMDAATLRSLSGINRRTTEARAEAGTDLGIQRRHDAERSAEIRDFVRFGLPWSAMSDRKRASEDLDLLRKPGFLPTAIVINILTSDDERADARVLDDDRVEIEESEDGSIWVVVPSDDNSWTPTGPAPIEVVDGQHRLWAFSPDDDSSGFELPVVAYRGLDISWQAYLFYTINVKPKRINTSLAFDLYPLLRTEDWLEREGALQIYRETRAQELTEVLWRFHGSPWFRRIDLLGESRRKFVSQAAWIRSLLASFVKPYEGANVKIGGLFGAPVGQAHMTLPWSRPQQAALIIQAWGFLQNAVLTEDVEWTQALRLGTQKELIVQTESDPAFVGPTTLLNTDQGVRAFMQVMNDLLYLQADQLSLGSWGDESGHEEPSDENVQEALNSLSVTEIASLIETLTGDLASYDWRTSAADGLDETQRQLKGRFRGSSGYRELRKDLLVHLEHSDTRVVADTAAEARRLLGLE